MASNTIKNVFIRIRPGENSRISDSLLIDIGDLIREAGLYVTYKKDEVDQQTLVLALGGDGTMLSAMHIAAEKGAFVTGFNYGSLGYLVPDSAKSGNELVSKLAGLLQDLADPGSIDEYKITQYSLPLLVVNGDAAINDFYFVPSANSSAADFKVSIGADASYFTTKSSGMVVSTPLGSTGLALSAGGSILAPNSRVLEVVPMLAHTLTSRPIIVPDSDKIVVSWDQKISIFADGRLLDDVGGGSVTIKCKKRKINIVRPKDWDFFENLKHKMNWESRLNQ